jgi:hypothetical protein
MGEKSVVCNTDALSSRAILRVTFAAAQRQGDIPKPSSILTEVGPHAVPSTAVQTYSRPHPRMMGPIILVRLLEMWSRHHCALSRHIGLRGSFDIHRSSGTRPISTTIATSRNANKPESPIQPTRFIAMHTALSFPCVTAGMVVFWHASRSSFITR